MTLNKGSHRDSRWGVGPLPRDEQITTEVLGHEAPARIFGLHPRKGALAAGSDADIVLADPDRETMVQGARLHSKARSSPFEGWRLRGALVMTILRGHVVMEDSRIVDEPPAGMFIPGAGAS